VTANRQTGYFSPNGNDHQYMQEPVLDPTEKKFLDDDCPNYHAECFLGNWNPDWFEYDRLFNAPRLGKQKTTRSCIAVAVCFNNFIRYSQSSCCKGVAPVRFGFRCHDTGAISDAGSHCS